MDPETGNVSICRLHYCHGHTNDHFDDHHHRDHCHNNGILIVMIFTFQEQPENHLLSQVCEVYWEPVPEHAQMCHHPPRHTFSHRCNRSAVSFREEIYIFFNFISLTIFFFLSFLYIVCTCRLDGPVPVRQGWLEGHRLLHGHNCPGCHTWHHTCVLYQVQIYIGRHTPALSYALLVWSPVKYRSTKWGKNIPISLSVYLLNTTYIG